MTVLHIHNEIVNKGGTEVYLADLQALLPIYGCDSRWIGIQETSIGWQWTEHGSYWMAASRIGLKQGLQNWITEKQIDIICLHNLFDSDLVRFLLSVRPVVKFSHSPVLVCPGRNKYWRYSNSPCTRPYGLHCFWHVYAEGCSNRHPKRILKAWNYVRNELNNAKTKYKAVVVMSEYNFNLLRECETPEDKIIINPYFTRDVSSSVVEEIGNSVRLNLLFIGRLVEGKGVIEMLKALGPILRENSNVHLNIIGDGLQTEEVRQLIGLLKIENSVSLLGWLPRIEIDKFLIECYAVIFPSTYPESFGIVGIEAMMASKPVVGFDVGGVSTWLKDNETGFLLKPGDIQGMTNALRKLLQDRELYETLSRNARKSALENFLPDQHMRKLILLFENIMNER